MNLLAGGVGLSIAIVIVLVTLMRRASHQKIKLRDASDANSTESQLTDEKKRLNDPETGTVNASVILNEEPPTGGAETIHAETIAIDLCHAESKSQDAIEATLNETKEVADRIEVTENDKESDIREIPHSIVTEEASKQDNLNEENFAQHVGVDEPQDSQPVQNDSPNPAIDSDVEEPSPPGDYISPRRRIRLPRQYRPVARAAPPPRRRITTTTSLGRGTRALPVSVRLLFEKGGFCRVSFLPPRESGMPEQITVSGGSESLEFVALQEEWYQDIQLPNAGQLLRNGIEWEPAVSTVHDARWCLSGREIYVLARHNELNGFVSTPRLALGEDHVVLCTTERVDDVTAAIALTNSPSPTRLKSDAGLPSGWSGLQGVVPVTPVAPSAISDILDALRPLAEVNIALEGGIRLERQTWLSGYPPSIRLRGDISTTSTVKIDDCDAMLLPDGSYMVPGWDSVGDHSVWCINKSRSYSIREGAEEWEAWDAYNWSLGEEAADGAVARPAICGALIHRPNFAAAAGNAMVISATNPILLGAKPGEIEICSPRADVRTGLCVGFPAFEPIWAVPADALHCDKRTGHVLQIGPSRPVLESNGSSKRTKTKARRSIRTSNVEAWCMAILAASRKGLPTVPPSVEVNALWKLYRSHAKALWRSWR